MAMTKGVKDALVRNTTNAIARAHDLHERICIKGATQNGDGFSRLLNVDRRDAASFIFFEVAAQYEYFCCEAFKIEVRTKFDVGPAKAENIMGSSDNGLDRVMGWAAPDVVQNRARNLFGKQGFFARFEILVTKRTYDTLSHAHKVRNRVAHSGPKAASKYNTILAQLKVPTASRKGLSVGRLLLDYPEQSPVDERWFSRFLLAYGRVVDEFDRHVAI